MTVIWRALTEQDLPAVVALAGRCVAADGGLPLVADEAFLRRRFAAPGGTARIALTPDGTAAAAGEVRPQDLADVRRGVVTGLIAPDHRGTGLGAALLDWALPAATALGPALVETEALTPAAATLFAARGLREIWAEEVMHFDLASTPLPEIALPPDLPLSPWTTDTAARFFATYTAAFRDRPGFPGWSAEQWIEWTADDEDFRPEWSLLLGDDAFITCATGWIVQVGVRPPARGRGLGAALITEALRRMRAAGERTALLDVNVDNPAGNLYRRLGFTVIGRRARFA